MPKSKRILLVAAMRSEVASIADGFPTCITGVGIHNARRVLGAWLEAADKPDLLVCAGLSGALVDDLHTGDIVVGTTLVFEGRTYQLAQLDPRAIAARSGPLCCSPRVVSDREERAALAAQTRALCVDMESGAVAEVGASAGIPVAVVRAIMDSVEDRLSAFESPLHPEDSARVRELIRQDLANGLDGKAHAAIDALARALLTILGDPSGAGL